MINYILTSDFKFFLFKQKESDRRMSKNLESSKISSSLKNINGEIDLDNVINRLNNTLGNYLDIFNLYNAKVVDESDSKRNLDIQAESSSMLVWSSNNNSNLFVRVNDFGDWIEKVNGENRYSFKFVKYDHNNGGLLLIDKDRNVYVEIDREQVRAGTDLDNLNRMYLGSWVDFDSSQDLTNLFNSTRNIYNSFEKFNNSNMLKMFFN